MILYANLDESNRVMSTVTLDNDENFAFFSDNPDYRIAIIPDGQCPVEANGHEYADYVYNEETKSFDYDPVKNIEYTDLESGETVTMTSDDLNAMVEELVDEKVRNNVEAILSEMLDAENSALKDLLIATRVERPGPLGT